MSSLDFTARVVIFSQNFDKTLSGLDFVARSSMLPKNLRELCQVWTLELEFTARRAMLTKSLPEL